MRPLNRLAWGEIYRGWQREDLQYYRERFPRRRIDFTRGYHEAAGR